MEIDSLKELESYPRTISGWHDVRFVDDESTAADFFEAVKQAICERLCAVLMSIDNYFTVKQDYTNKGEFQKCLSLIMYPVTQNTLRYELIELIEEAIYEIAPYFLCGVGDHSSGHIGYYYKKDYTDFPFFLGKDKFGVNDDIAFFKRPNVMCTWKQMRECGYAYRLMNAINAMTSLKITRCRLAFTSKGHNYSFSGEYKNMEKFLKDINNSQHKVFVSIFEYKGYSVNVEYVYGMQFFGYRIITNNKGQKAYSIIYPYTANEIYKCFHPGNGIGANCILRGVNIHLDTYSDIKNDTGIKDTYVENIPFISTTPQEPMFCPYKNEIVSNEIHFTVLPEFSPSVLPPEPDQAGTVCYQYGQRYLFNQWFDFGIEGGFRFRSGS